jgi:hypothetical protein
MPARATLSIMHGRITAVRPPYRQARIIGLRSCWQPASLSGTMGQMTDRMMVARWLAGYQAAWRSPGTDGLAEIFTEDAVYLHSPYEEPVAGLDAIMRMWGTEDRQPSITARR